MTMHIIHSTAASHTGYRSWSPHREAQEPISQSSLTSEGGPFHDLTTHFSSGTHCSSFLPVASGCTCPPKMAKGLHWLELDMQVNSCSRLSRLTQLNLLQASQLSLFLQCPILVFSCWLKGSNRRKRRSCDLLWEGCRKHKPKWVVTGTNCLQRGLCDGSKLPSNQTPLWEANFSGGREIQTYKPGHAQGKAVLLTPRSTPCKLWGTATSVPAKLHVDIRAGKSTPSLDNLLKLKITFLSQSHFRAIV